MSADSALNSSLKEQGWQKGSPGGDADNAETASRVDSTEIIAVPMGGLPALEEEVDTGSTLKGSALKPVSNAYVGKRNFIHQLMDVALIMANVSQMKALLATENNDYFLLLMTFISLSIILQVVFTICMLGIMSIERKLEDNSNSELPTGRCPKTEKKKWLAIWLDRVGSILVLFVIVSNVFIAGFGVENHKQNVTPQPSPQ